LADQQSLPVEIKENVLFASSAIPGLGREPEVIGTSSVLAPGKLSAPIKGQQGVFVIVVDSRGSAPALENAVMSASSLNANFAGRVDYEVFEALKKKADVKDNRAKFY
jgi:peptidylprolyl isomerase/peptidyl-prolyl cis-trans isomerase D